jgi:hypothetical protein
LYKHQKYHCGKKFDIEVVKVIASPVAGGGVRVEGVAKEEVKVEEDQQKAWRREQEREGQVKSGIEGRVRKINKPDEDDAEAQVSRGKVKPKDDKSETVNFVNPFYSDLEDI